MSKQVLTEKNLWTKPQLICNLDEKVYRLTLHHSQEVLVLQGEKRVHLIRNEHTKNAPVVACSNAFDHTIPLMILYYGKRKKPTYCYDLPSQSQVVMTEKGSMTITVFNQWLKHFYKFKEADDVLLILNGTKFHLDVSICLSAEEKSIDIFCLPSNITHELQSLDKSCFKLFEHYWDELLTF